MEQADHHQRKNRSQWGSVDNHWGIERRSVESEIIAWGKGVLGKGTADAKTLGRIKPTAMMVNKGTQVWTRSGRFGGMHTESWDIGACEGRKTKREWSPWCQVEEATQEGGRNDLALKGLIKTEYWGRLLDWLLQRPGQGPHSWRGKRVLSQWEMKRRKSRQFF